MANAPLVPTVRRRRLGQALRRFRNEANLNLEEAAERLVKLDDEIQTEGKKRVWTGPKLSRIETAKANISAAEVTVVLNAYGVTDPEVFSALEGLARHANKRGWWQTYSGLLAPAYADYISLEDDAARISEWAPLLIPGLLQTAGYARESLACNNTTRPPEEITALAELRMARQAVLTRPNPPTLWAVIHEAVLHQRFATRPITMREQLRKLLDSAELPNVTLQIMPLAATPHPGTNGGFTLVGFPRPMPDVVHLENLIGASYAEAVEEVTTFANAFERIQAVALSPDDSLALISQLEERSRT